MPHERRPLQTRAFATLKRSIAHDVHNTLHADLDPLEPRVKFMHPAPPPITPNYRWIQARGRVYEQTG